MMRTLTLLLLAVFGMGANALAQIGVTIFVSGGSNPTCQGRNVTFSATPSNAGTAPTYQWFVNGTRVPGAVGGSFTTNSLMNGDYVQAQVKRSTAPFDSNMSNSIAMVVVTNVTPAVSKTITSGANPGCVGAPLQFTASTTNAGLSPIYQWFVNGNPVGGNSSTYTNFTGVTGDRVWVRIIGGGLPTACYTRDSAWSDTTSLVRRPVPALPVISFIGKDLISDSANVQWYGPAGIIPGATGPVYRPTVQGPYYAMIPNPLCGTGKSNVLIVSPLEIGNYNMSGVQMYPNPTTGKLSINWGMPATARIIVYTPAGQAVLHDAVANSASKTLDLSRLASGIYFIMLQDEQGNRGAMRVLVSH